MLRVTIVAAIASLLGLLSACQSAQQACASYGYSPGTLEFAQCSERRSYETQRAWQRQSEFWNAYNAATMNAAKPTPAPVNSGPRCYHVLANGACAHWGP